MKFKDFIYYLLLVVIAGMFVVLAFSYFKKVEVIEVEYNNQFEVVELITYNSFDDVDDFNSINFLEFSYLEIFYYGLFSYYFKLDVSDFLNVEVLNNTYISGYDFYIEGKRYYFNSYINILDGSAYFEISPDINIFGDVGFSIKGVKYVQ